MLDYIIKIIDGKRKADKLLLQSFLKDLPSNGNIEYIRDLTGRSWHRESAFSHLNTILHEWDNVEHEFFDKTLEKKKKDFFKVASDYIQYFAFNTFVQNHNLDWAEVPDEWEENNPEKYKEVCSAIPKKGNMVWREYNELVRLAKKRLNKHRYLWIVYLLMVLAIPLIIFVAKVILQKYI